MAIDQILAVKRVNKNTAWCLRFKVESVSTFFVIKMYMLIFGGFLLPGWCSAWGHCWWVFPQCHNGRDNSRLTGLGSVILAPTTLALVIRDQFECGRLWESNLGLVW